MNRAKQVKNMLAQTFFHTLLLTPKSSCVMKSISTMERNHPLHRRESTRRDMKKQAFAKEFLAKTLAES